jgi:hypothetical protein
LVIVEIPELTVFTAELTALIAHVPKLQEFNDSFVLVGVSVLVCGVSGVVGVLV